MSVNLPAEDPLIRMQRDLKRAKTKNLKDIKWGMVIDLAKCIGCHASTIACITENNLPPGVVYRVVLEEEVGHYPHMRRVFTPRPCLHCMYRATEQWFISMQENGLRDKALAAIRQVTWTPAWGMQCIYSMVENRPDWCLSRQALLGGAADRVHLRGMRADPSRPGGVRPDRGDVRQGGRRCLVPA